MPKKDASRTSIKPDKLGDFVFAVRHAFSAMTPQGIGELREMLDTYGELAAKCSKGKPLNFEEIIAGIDNQLAEIREEKNAGSSVEFQATLAQDRTPDEVSEAVDRNIEYFGSRIEILSRMRSAIETSYKDYATIIESEKPGVSRQAGEDL